MMKNSSLLAFFICCSLTSPSWAIHLKIISPDNGTIDCQKVVIENVYECQNERGRFLLFNDDPRPMLYKYGPVEITDQIQIEKIIDAENPQGLPLYLADSFFISPLDQISKAYSLEYMRSNYGDVLPPEILQKLLNYQEAISKKFEGGTIIFTMPGSESLTCHNLKKCEYYFCPGTPAYLTSVRYFDGAVAPSIDLDLLPLGNLVEAPVKAKNVYNSANELLDLPSYIGVPLTLSNLAYHKKYQHLGFEYPNFTDGSYDDLIQDTLDKCQLSEDEKKL